MGMQNSSLATALWLMLVCGAPRDEPEGGENHDRGDHREDDGNDGTRGHFRLLESIRGELRGWITLRHGKLDAIVWGANEARRQRRTSDGWTGIDVDERGGAFMVIPKCRRSPECRGSEPMLLEFCSGQQNPSRTS
jgi:hypothetical protein